MFLDETISEDEFESQRKDLDKQIASIQETLNELESLCGFEDVKQTSSKQISKLISEGKTEGFNKELFDLLVKQIVIGGKRSDGVDDSKSLHYELINYNLNTDMKKVVQDGMLRYTMDFDMQEAMEYLVAFISCGENDTKPGPKLLDWEQDAKAIIADVNKVAGREIRSLPYLHWWTFLAYFQAIGEGQLSTIVSIRDKLRRGKKLEKWEQDFYRENKSRVDFKKKYSAEDLAEQERLKKLLGE